jgi:hypothetical protein
VVYILEANQQKIKKLSFGKKKITAIAMAVIVIVIVATTSALLTNNQNPSSNQTNNQNTPQSWITKGAYATYAGQANVLSMTVSFKARMEIVDFNQTHIRVATDFNMTTPFGTNQNTTTTWVNREDMTYQPDGLTLNNTYTTQVSLPNLGTRTCTVYEYSSQGISAAYYVDKSVQWPIKMIMTSPTVEGQYYSMNINLVDSNIPGL